MRASTDSTVLVLGVWNESERRQYSVSGRSMERERAQTVQC